MTELSIQDELTSELEKIEVLITEKEVKMEKKKLGVLLCGICLLLTFPTLPFIISAGSAAEKPIELKVSHFWPPASAQNDHMLRWKKKLEADSEGRLTIRIFPSGTLLKPTLEWEGLIKGVTDILYGVRLDPEGGEFNGKLCLFTTGGAGATMGGKLLYDLYNEFEVYRAQWRDVKFLWLSAAGPTLIHSRKAIRKLEDMKNLQMRVPPTNIGVELNKLLGSTPVTMPMSEVYMALQKGIVDGAVGPYEVLKSFRLTDVTRYTTDAYLYLSLGHHVSINLDAYNKLPVDLRKVLTDSAEWGKQDSWKMYDTIDTESIEYAKEKGHEFISLAPSERERWQAVIKPLQDRIAADLDAKGYPGTKLKDFIIQRIKDYSK